jgi:HK97 family phage major capsid protein
MENMEQLMEEVKDLSKNVADTLEANKKKEEELDKKIEEILKEKHNVDKAMIQTEDEVAPRFKGYYGARQEVAKGKVAKTVLWDEKTEDKFVEWVHMVKDNDKAGIKKAYGDNPYTETTSAGGYLVPTVFVPELVRAIYQKSILLPKVTIVPMPVSKIEMPSVTAGYTAGWGTINTQVADSKITLGQVSLSAEKLVALSLVPNELMEDSGIPIAGLLADEFADAFAKKIDEEILDGDSSDTTNHRFDGWGYASSTIGYSPDDDATPTLAEEVTVANLIAEVGALQASDPNALDGAEWFFNPTVWALIRNLQGNVSDGAGGTIASGLPLVNIDKEWNYNLLGFPVNISAQAAATETVELAWGYFGNPRYIYVGDMMSMSVESSKDSRFSYDQTEFLARQRLAIAVGVPASLGVLKFGATP